MRSPGERDIIRKFRNDFATKMITAWSKKYNMKFKNIEDFNKELYHRVRHNMDLGNWYELDGSYKGKVDTSKKLKFRKITSPKHIGLGRSDFYDRFLDDLTQIYGYKIFQSDYLAWIDSFNPYTSLQYYIDTSEKIDFSLEGVSLSDIQLCVEYGKQANSRNELGTKFMTLWEINRILFSNNIHKTKWHIINSQYNQQELYEAFEGIIEMSYIIENTNQTSNSKRIDSSNNNTDWIKILKGDATEEMEKLLSNLEKKEWLNRFEMIESISSWVALTRYNQSFKYSYFEIHPASHMSADLLSVNKNLFSKNCNKFVLEIITSNYLRHDYIFFFSYDEILDVINELQKQSIENSSDLTHFLEDKIIRSRSTISKKLPSKRLESELSENFYSNPLFFPKLYFNIDKESGWAGPLLYLDSTNEAWIMSIINLMKLRKIHIRLAIPTIIYDMDEFKIHAYDKTSHYEFESVELWVKYYKSKASFIWEYSPNINNLEDELNKAVKITIDNYIELKEMEDPTKIPGLIKLKYYKY